MSDRTRTVTWSDPALTARGASGKTGRAFLQSIIDGEVPPAPIQHTLGFALVETGNGFAKFAGTFGEHMYNPMMGVHGGVACTLLDSAMGASVMSALDDKTAYASPMETTLLGVRQYVIVSADRVLGMSHDKHELLWSFPWSTDHDANAVQPIASPSSPSVRFTAFAEPTITSIANGT